MLHQEGPVSLGQSATLFPKWLVLAVYSLINIVVVAALLLAANEWVIQPLLAGTFNLMSALVAGFLVLVAKYSLATIDGAGWAFMYPMDGVILTSGPTKDILTTRMATRQAQIMYYKRRAAEAGSPHQEV